MAQPWYNVERVKQPGSVILRDWIARGGAKQVRAEGEYIAMPDIRKGTELFEWMTGGMSAAGVAVTEQTAMRVSAVYACVSMIGGALASLPLHVYRRTEDGRERANQDIWWLLNEQPHPAWSAATFWEYMAASKLLLGDAYARILRAPGGYSPKIIGFEPLHKTRVTTQKRDGLLLYGYTEDDGSVTAIEQSDMLHIPGPGFDGLTGMSQIRHALRNPAGISLAADEYSARFFSNGARPDFAIEVPGNVSREQQDMIRETWKNRYGGAENAHLPALMAGGMKVQELTMNAEDAQLIDTRRFQVEDIARIFGVPPHMIGHTDKTTSWGTGVEQMSIGFVKYTLQRHLVKFEQEINRKVWPSRERYFVEFATAGLERGDYKSRNEGYRIALGRAGEPGWMTVNEVRKLENMPPLDGADDLNKVQPVPAPSSDPSPDTQAQTKAQIKIAEIQADAVKTAPAPIINVAAPVVNVAPAAVTVEPPVVTVAAPSVTVEPPAVTVENHITTPDPTVTVEAIMPAQAAPTVNVAPAIVNVTNEVQPADISQIEITAMPARETVSSIKRDGAGNIIQTTQIETDA